MARKAKNKTRKRAASNLPENILPQNILAVGEHVEENKNIYIFQPTYKKIHSFTKNKTTNESGGMLVGTIIEELGKTNIIITGFVEAKFCEATPTTLKFTHETWEYVHKEIEKTHPGKKIVGWIHTHPDFGIFLSEYDKFIHQNFFKEDYQVAYVVDPIGNIEGFYFWINEKIEKCKGFYIYDKTGEEITVGEEKEIAKSTNNKTHFGIKNILIAILTVAVTFLIFSNISTGNKLEKIENQQEAIVNSANQSLSYLQQQLWLQSDEIQKLTDILKEAGIVEEETESNEQEAGNGVADNEESSESSASSPDNTISGDEADNLGETSGTDAKDSSEKGNTSNE